MRYLMIFLVASSCSAASWENCKGQNPNMDRMWVPEGWIVEIGDQLYRDVYVSDIRHEWICTR